ncbi:hypothetical protein ACQ86N_29060 [Puia sp. P3]|uniref:hypothetical protein n=1 Tax=Puia sp. P3 TaxID=3423952 RepID=UPI003D6695BB
MRFPGGCLVHGDGLGNIYRWKNTIGPAEQRIEQKNIWNYHQSTGLGFFEYFQFCEDIGATPVPIVAAGVSCQNSGGTGVSAAQDKRTSHGRNAVLDRGRARPDRNTPTAPNPPHGARNAPPPATPHPSI